MESKITAIGIAVPPYKRKQSDIAKLICLACHLNEEQEDILTTIYKGTGIDTRYGVMADYCRTPDQFEFFPNHHTDPFPNTSKRMALYKKTALPLALDAINNCLDSALDKKDITHLIIVSCTGMYAPGLDIEIIQSLQLNPTTERTAINFMGCYGAFNGLKVADAFCKADKEAKVLLVCVECCSIHFKNDFSIDNIVSNALFSDGAAAVLIEGNTLQNKYLKLEQFHCDLVPETEQDMAWNIGDQGFDMVLSSYVPKAIKGGIVAFIQVLLNLKEWDIKDIDYFAIHPGGMKILQACESALGITEQDNRFSYQVLKNYGNMSSVTVLFVLKALWDSLGPSDKNKKVFSCAFGPGLTLEAMLLKIQW